MNFDDLKKAIEIFKESGLTYMEFEQDGMRVAFDNRQNQAVVASTPVVATSNANQAVEDAPSASEDKFYVTSPLVGTFHQAPSEKADPFVRIGSKVKRGDKLCIIEAMKVMNEITSDKDGIITNILVKEGQMVEYGQKLFVIGD